MELKYSEKQNQIYEALEKTNYDFFNKDKILAINTIDEAMCAPHNYSNAVALKNSHMISYRIQYRNNQNKLNEIEKQENQNVDKAYTNLKKEINFLNELCNSLNLDPFTTIDLNDKTQVENFVKEYSDETHYMIKNDID